MKKLLLLLFLTGSLKATEPLAVYLTARGDLTSSMAIHWIAAPKSSELKFRKEDESTWQSISAKIEPLPQELQLTVQTVFLQNLEPGTTYLFLVPGSLREHKFRTIDPNQTIRFVVGGDHYHDRIQPLIEMNREAAKTSPHFVLVGGDIAYAASSKSTLPQNWERWSDWITTWSMTMITPEGYLIPIAATVGNHDVTGRYDQTPEQANFFHTLFALPSSYYSVDIPKRASIIALNSGHSESISGVQTDWLSSALQARENQPFLFAFYHVPAYPSHRSYWNSQSIELRSQFVPLFEKYQLTAAFEHHEHTYKRSHPIFNGEVDHERGVLYLGDGAWGTSIPRDPLSPLDVWYLAETAAKQHFILVDLTEEEVIFSAIDHSGELFDATTQTSRPIAVVGEDSLFEEKKKGT